MDVQQAKVESVSNNLANATTPGYKKEYVQAQSFPELLLIQQGGTRSNSGLLVRYEPQKIGTLGTGAQVAGVSIDYTPGAVQETGNSTDVMIKGPGFFAVNVPKPRESDRVCYTRNGVFKLDAEGYLTIDGGYRVLGEAGEIKVEGDKFKISPDGTIEVSGTLVDRLRLVEFDDANSLYKEAGMYIDVQGGGRQASSTTVAQGYLERSNVNMVDEMVDLVSLMRTYEANQRLIQSHDEILAKAVNQVGSLR